MGYTRYWNRTTKPITKEFINEVNLIISDCTKRGITLCNGLGEGNPIITEDYIALNGSEELSLAHETFALDNNEDAIGFDFCKTARKPYDYAVRRILEEAEKFGLVDSVQDDGPNDEIISDQEFLEGKNN